MIINQSCLNYSLLQGLAAKAMLAGMKKFRISGLLILAMVSTFAANAALYKGVDAKGNVVYSDKPFETAKKYRPPSISVVGTDDEAAEEEVTIDKKTAEFKYREFDILSPAQNQIIGSDTVVRVSLNLKPGLNTKKAHSITMLVDGVAQVENTKSLSIPLGQLYRGMHKLQAQVKDAEGKVILRTRTTLISIQPK